jgi:hypothetical protein
MLFQIDCIVVCIDFVFVLIYLTYYYYSGIWVESNFQIYIDQICNSFILYGQVRESGTILKIKRGEGDSGL